MSNAGAQAHKFYEEVANNRVLWAGKIDEDDFLEFDLADSKVSLPLWSSKSRLERLKKLNPELLGEVEPVEITWDDFINIVAPKLKEKGRLIGVNLSGKNITGYDRDIDGVIKSIESYIKNGS